MRFLLRLLSLVCLAAATIAGTLDSIQSIAAAKVQIASFAEGWKAVSPASYEAWTTSSSGAAPTHFSDVPLRWALSQPAFAVLLIVSLLLWMIAYRKSSAASRFAV